MPEKIRTVSPASLGARDETTPKNEQPKNEKKEMPRIVETPKNKGGRPAFNPSDEQRGIVKALAMVGLSREGIADSIDIDSDTLAKHFRKELREGRIHGLAKAVRVVFNGMDAPKESDRLSAAFYYLDRKAKEYGWTTKMEVAPRREIYSGLDFSRLNHGDMDELRRILVKAGAAIEPSDIPQVAIPEFKRPKPKK